MLEGSGSRLEWVFEGSDRNACWHELLLCLFLMHVKSVWFGFWVFFLSSPQPSKCRNIPLRKHLCFTALLIHTHTKGGEKTQPTYDL